MTGFGKILHNEFFLKIKFDVWLISSTHFRLIAHFIVEIHRFVCDRATPPINYGVPAYYALNRISINWSWAGPFEMNVKIEQGSSKTTVDCSSMLKKLTR